MNLPARRLGRRMNDGLHRLALSSGPGARARHVGDGGVPVQHRLDSGRVDVLAAADDHVLGSVQIRVASRSASDSPFRYHPPAKAAAVASGSRQYPGEQVFAPDEHARRPPLTPCRARPDRLMRTSQPTTPARAAAAGLPRLGIRRLQQADHGLALGVALKICRNRQPTHPAPGVARTW